MLRCVILAMVSLALAACQPSKGPGESGLPTYYGTSLAVGSSGIVIPAAR